MESFLITKSRLTIIGAIAVVIIVLVSGFLLLPRQSEELLSPETAQGNSEATNLGFTYLPVTPRVSAYYDLGVDSGALITEVIPQSLAASAGVEVGDVVLSFNGVRVEEEVPLLGMMMTCPAGHRIVLEVLRGGNVSTVELIHIER